jgi:hypothetical protein
MCACLIVSRVGALGNAPGNVNVARSASVACVGDEGWRALVRTPGEWRKLKSP